MNIKYVDSPSETFKISEVRRVVFTKSLAKNLQFNVFKSATDPKEQLVTMQPKRRQNIQPPTQKYSARIPIAVKKYNDLVDLCKNKLAIPICYHDEYLNLPNSIQMRDALVEPDEEEGDD